MDFANHKPRPRPSEGTGPKPKRVSLEDDAAGTIPAGQLLSRLARVAWSHRVAALPALFTTTASSLLFMVSAAVEGLAIDQIKHAASNAAERVQQAFTEVAVGATADIATEASEPALMPEQPPEWPLGIVPPESWGDTTVIAALGLIIVLIAAFGGYARYGQRVANEHFTQACNIDLRMRLYRKLQSMGFTFFDDHETGQIIQRVTQDTVDVRSFLQGVMIQVVVSVVMLSVFLAWMLAQSPVLTLFCMVFIPIELVAIIIYGRVTKPRFKQHARNTDHVVQAYKESIEGVRVIRVFGRAQMMFERFCGRSEHARDYRIGIARITGMTMPLFMVSGMVTTAVILGVGGTMVIEGGLALGTLWTFFRLMGRFGSQVESIVMIAAQTPTALAGAERIFKLLDAQPDVAPPTAEAEIARELGPLRGEVVFDNVSFGYLPGQTVLKDVSFTVSPGETIAVVGPTGSGKSTLLSLVARFYDPDAGSVRIDGVDLQGVDPRDLRRRIGFVFQEAFLFSNTVRNNVTFGVPGAKEEEFERAIQAASATNFINELPEGANTVIGERGVSLSGGQRQRLTIARALVMRPDILVLDDATGAVDAITEAHIQDALDHYLGVRTTFVVAHRLSTLRKADRIIVLEKGKIIDIGSHDELMNKPGHYRAAALIQLETKDDDDSPSAHTSNNENDGGEL